MANATQQYGRTVAAIAAAVVGLGGTLAVTACGSAAVSGSASPSAAATSAAASSAIPCTQISSLRTSLTSLAHATVKPSSAGQIAVDLDDIHAQLMALNGQAGAFSGQASQLDAALGKITAAARVALRAPTAANLKSLSSDVSQLKATAQPIVTEINSACPGSS
jgi:hypothetical protein